MTVEEAGQRLLEGKAFVVCLQCEGTGDEERDTTSGPRLLDCSKCWGTGSTLEPTYAEACALLGATPPLLQPIDYMERLTLRAKRDMRVEADQHILQLFQTGEAPSDS